MPFSRFKNMLNTCCRGGLFHKESFQNPVEFNRNLHHRGMAAFVDEMQFAVRYQFFEFLTYEWRSDGVVVTPYQTSRLLYLIQLIAKVVADGTFCKGDDFDDFQTIVRDFKSRMDNSGQSFGEKLVIDVTLDGLDRLIENRTIKLFDY